MWGGCSKLSNPTAEKQTNPSQVVAGFKKWLHRWSRLEDAMSWFVGGGPSFSTTVRRHHLTLVSGWSVSLRGGTHKISPVCIFAFAFFCCSPRCLLLLIAASRPSVCPAKLCHRHVMLVSSSTRSPLVTAGRRCPSDLGSAPFHLGAAAALAHQASLTQHLRPALRLGCLPSLHALCGRIHKMYLFL